MATSPAERLFFRQTKGLLPLATQVTQHNTAILQEDTDSFERRQWKQSTSYNKGARNLSRLSKGNKVWVKPHKLGDKSWQPGTVVAETEEPLSYRVKLNNGGEIRQNRRYLRQQNQSQEHREDLFGWPTQPAGRM